VTGRAGKARPAAAGVRCQRTRRESAWIKTAPAAGPSGGMAAQERRRQTAPSPAGTTFRACVGCRLRPVHLRPLLRL